MSVVCFTDGSALKNSKNSPAGWAVYFPYEKILLSKGIHGTNNFAELTAISAALYFANEKLNLNNTELIIYTDSEYCIKVMKDSAKIKANYDKIKHCRDLIKTLIENGNKITFKHVEAHTGNSDFISKCNDIVDKKAREMATKIKNDELNFNQN